MGNTSDIDDLRTRIRDVLGTHGRLAVPVDDLRDDDNLFRAGLSSHANVAVMLALEDEFGIEFTDGMLRKETFESVSAIRGAVSQLVLEAGRVA
jgi:acyl carrier protein